MDSDVGHINGIWIWLERIFAELGRKLIVHQTHQPKTQEPFFKSKRSQILTLIQSLVVVQY